MPIIRQIVKYNNGSISGDTLNIKINLGSTDAFIGLQQEIDSMTSFTGIDLINPVTDGETRRFKYHSGSVKLNFKFYSSGIGNWYNNFLVPGFTATEIINHESNMNKSFFILDYYDSFDIYTQNRIFTMYLTKILREPPPYNSDYIINSTINNQFYRWHIPQSYIDELTGDTITGYVKFSFYNAKSGRIQLFYNSDNEALTTPEKFYFKTELNLINRTWQIITPSVTSIGEIIAKELPYSTNQQYTDRVNDTFENFENIRQNYPSGSTFNYEDGHYLIT
jgi:hypothetical protein